MTNVKEMLNEEIGNQISELAGLEAGTEEKSKAVDDLSKLYKLKIEESKNATELQEKKKDRIFSVVKDVALAGIPMIFYAHWMKKGFKFEETGTFTSTTFRGLFNKFKPTK